jgi:hypothetical protein
MLRSIACCAVISLSAVVAVSAQEVDIRLKEGTDFSRYSTYAWAPHLDLEDDHPLADDSPLDLKIKRVADADLAGKGYQRVDREEGPDLLINYVGFGTDVTSVEGVKKDLAPGVAWIGDPQAHSMRSYREGTLVFEVVDTAADEMVWSGWVSDLARNFEKLRAKAEKATHRVFTHFPEK